MVRPGWRPLAVAHTHADWIGHCTACSSASEQGNCVRRSYIYPIGYRLTQPRVHLGYRVVMFNTRKAIWTALSWRDTVLKSVSISAGITLRDHHPMRDSEFQQRRRMFNVWCHSPSSSQTIRVIITTGNSRRKRGDVYVAANFTVPRDSLLGTRRWNEFRRCAVHRTRNRFLRTVVNG